MRSFLILVSVLFFSLQPVQIHLTIQKNSSKTTKETVYICDGKYATKYHSEEDCRGLNACKAEIKSMDKQEAIRLGREECSICY